MKTYYFYLGDIFFEINKVWLFTELLLGTTNYDLIDKIINEMSPAFKNESEVLTKRLSCEKEGSVILRYEDKFRKGGILR